MRKIVVITGGIGAGKSFICNYIAEKWKQKVIYTDNLAKELMKKNNIAYKKIVSKYGGKFLDSNGDLDKLKLSEYIFSDYKNRKAINEIVHPIVKKEVIKRSENITFVETAIMMEAKFYDLGPIWYVDAPVDDRIERLIKERKIDWNTANMIIKAQSKEEEGLEIADVIIDNAKGRNPLEEVDKLMTELLRNEIM